MARITPSRRELLVGSCAVAASMAMAADRPPPGSLHALAAARGLICGAAVDYNWLGDAALMAGLAIDCNTLQLATGNCWPITQGKPDAPFDFHEAEGVYAAARAHRQRLRGHALIWSDGSMPQWVRALEPDLTPASAEKMMVGYVRDSMRPWRGRLIGQDVVNEPIDSNGLQNTLWYRKLGERFIDLSFHAAAEADPGCNRTLNQDWIELDTSECVLRRENLLRLLERLLKRGVPVQTLGIEGHLDSRHPFSEAVWRRFLDEIGGMGLKIIVTEYDVNDHMFSGDAARRDAQSAALLGAFLSTTLSYPNCLGIVSQSWSDRYNWYEIVGRKHNDGSVLRPNPLDIAYRRKPQYDAIVAAIRSAPVR